jgi:hypothetical protein
MINQLISLQELNQLMIAIEIWNKKQQKSVSLSLFQIFR